MENNILLLRLSLWIVRVQIFKNSNVKVKLMKFKIPKSQKVMIVERGCKANIMAVNNAMTYFLLFWNVDIMKWKSNIELTKWSIMKKIK